MPLYNHPNFGDVQRFIFMKGIITSVDSENDTADVTIPGANDGSDVPIFYHCDPDSEERDNGAIKGGSSPFSAGSEAIEADPEADPPVGAVEAVEGDSVIVMYDVENNNAVRIIGFVDGIKRCETILIVFTFTYDGDGYHTVWDIIANKVCDDIGFDFPCADEDLNDDDVTFKDWLENKEEVDDIESFLVFDQCSESLPLLTPGSTHEPRCGFAAGRLVDGEFIEGKFDSRSRVEWDEEHECANEDEDNTPVGWYGGLAGSRGYRETLSRYGIYSKGDPALYYFAHPELLSTSTGPFISATVKYMNGVEPVWDCRQDMDSVYERSGEIDCYYVATTVGSEDYIFSFLTPIGALEGFSFNGLFSSIDYGWAQRNRIGCTDGSTATFKWSDFNSTGWNASLARALWSKSFRFQIYFYDSIVKTTRKSWIMDCPSGVSPDYAEWVTNSYERNSNFIAAIDYFPDGDGKECDIEGQPEAQSKHEALTDAITALHAYTLTYFDEVDADQKVLTDLEIKFINK